MRRNVAVETAVLGQNAASVISETDLRNVDNPKFPDNETMDAFMAHLSYCQFTASRQAQAQVRPLLLARLCRAFD